MTKFSIQSFSLFGDNEENAHFELERIDSINSVEYWANVVYTHDAEEVKTWLKNNYFLEAMERQKVICPQGYPLVRVGSTYKEPLTFTEWLDISSRFEKIEAFDAFIEAHKEMFVNCTQWQFDKGSSKMKYQTFKKLEPCLS